MKRIFYFLALYIIAQPQVACAQDPHFSQFFNSPVYYNPATTGLGVEHIRLTAIYRQQWPNLAKAFNTQFLQFDKQVSKVGLGAYVLKNSAGPSSLQKLQLSGTISYRLQLNRHHFTGGINIGLIQKSFDPGQMTFDDQYLDDAGYSASNPTSETFSYIKLIRPDFGAGTHYIYGSGNENIKIRPFLGVSLLHINKAKESFIEFDNITPDKQIFNTGAIIKINAQVELKPTITWQQQQFSNELMFGSTLKYKTEAEKSIEAGIFIRNKESAIVYTGYQWNSLALGLSYDASLANHIGGPGAFELSLSYVPKTRTKHKKQKKEKTTTTKSKTSEQVYVPETKTETKIDNDIDGDGIPNKIDDCPYIKGNIGTYGCPDTDGDGIADMSDRCPLEKGLIRNQGCPEKSLGRIKNKMTVLFEVNESNIKGFDIIDVLEPVVDELYFDSTLQVIISGHTSNEGDALFNMKLSQERADAVKSYLVYKGVSEVRIKMIAYGETIPADTNDTEEGRKKNRRTEVNIVRQQ